MSKTGFGQQGSWLADDSDRVSVSGKHALLVEVIDTPASGGVIQVLRGDNATAYTKTPLDATTAAAICSDIRHCLAVSIERTDTTLNDLTTTVNMIGGYQVVNGDTTLVIVGVHNNNDSESYRIVVFGTAF